MKEKKICFFISSLSNAGGTERVCTEIANHLSQSGFLVTILCMYAGQPFFNLDSNVTTLYVHTKKSYSKILIPATIFKVRQKLKNIAPHVLINVDSALFVYSAVAGVGLKIKNLVWEHFNYNAGRYSVARILSRKLAGKFSDAIITLTNADNSNWTNNQLCKAPVITINNPSPPIPADLQAGSSRELVVLAVGRLNLQKGFDLLLDAWHIVNSKNTGNWQLHIIGSGELKQELEQKVRDLNLKNSVKLIPATPAIYPHFNRAGIYCLSSRYEGFPMVLLEAQTFGLPIVSFDCETGPKEIIKHNETGLLVPKDNTQALAKALLSLKNDDAKRIEMGANALKRALDYNIESIIKKWEKLLTTI
ncbi:glycosyltransferase family 4 protein [Mucilaginibacter sp. HD30]